MKLLLDFFPIAAFFLGFYLAEDRSQGIYVGTMAAIIAGFIQVAASWLLIRKVEKMHVITLLALVLFGSLTLLLQDERFIKWKPTVVNWLFSLILLSSHVILRKNLIQKMLAHAIALPQHVWNNLSLAWAAFFFILGALNLYIAFSFSNEIWVNFRMFGSLSLTLLFVIAQGFYISRHMIESKEEN
ncbi:MAG: septation protein A [Gammaproteobacteria bacterium]